MTSAVLAVLKDDPHTSVSAITSYLTCPQRHYFQYIARAPQEHRPASLVFGSVMHVALAHYYRQLMVSSEPLVDDLVELHYCRWLLLPCDPALFRPARCRRLSVNVGLSHQISPNEVLYPTSACCGLDPHSPFGVLTPCFCSMAKATWLQDDGATRNPYCGSKMLGCAEVVGGGGK